MDATSRHAIACTTRVEYERRMVAAAQAIDAKAHDVLDAIAGGATDREACAEHGVRPQDWHRWRSTPAGRAMWVEADAARSSAMLDGALADATHSGDPSLAWKATVEYLKLTRPDIYRDAPVVVIEDRLPMRLAQVAALASAAALERVEAAAIAVASQAIEVKP